MSDVSTDLRTKAEALMKQRRLGEAIEALRRHLADEPGDLRALLELGICHLLNGSEEWFLAIRERARRALAAAGRTPAGVARLWRQYEALFRKVTATAVVLGAMTAAGCESASQQSPAGGGQGANAMTRPAPETRPAGQVGAPATATRPSAPETRPTYSGHRYSAGVRPTLRPRPWSGHKYSGGVYLPPTEEKK